MSAQASSVVGRNHSKCRQLGLHAEAGEDVALSRNDRVYLETLGLQLDMYPEMRTTTEG
jgi:hypothetical protein